MRMNGPMVSSATQRACSGLSRARLLKDWDPGSDVWHAPEPCACMDLPMAARRDTGDFASDTAAADDLIRQYLKDRGVRRVVVGRGLQAGDTAVLDMKMVGGWVGGEGTAGSA